MKNRKTIIYSEKHALKQIVKVVKNVGQAISMLAQREAAIA